MISPIDVEDLRRRVGSATPFPHFVIDNFLDPEFARQAHNSFPSFEDALKLGRTFSTVNEKKKIQITDSARFPPAVLELNRLLAAPAWTGMLSEIFGIPNLLPDEELFGGGMQQTGPRGRLDVHVDFNYIPERQLHRRLNILVFLNPKWQAEWGGKLELWDAQVKHCHQSIEPLFNRCVIFETSEISYHGVTVVNCPADCARKSFAAYYYTKEPPAHWTGTAHDTIFRSRPNEVIPGRVLMPAQQAARRVRNAYWGLKRRIKTMIKPPAQV